MIISIASGKGGTGKTTVAVNLALSIDSGVQLLDCDVEEPNAHLFLRPQWDKVEQFTSPVPDVDEEVCTRCGKCAEICQFKAITLIGETILTFPELCHSCGGCRLVCPVGAVREEGRELGTLRVGRSNGLALADGELKVGVALAPPLVKRVRTEAMSDRIVIIDAPPGTSCPVIAAVKQTDFVVLVTEPTPFGLSDLRLAVEVIKILGLPCGLVINRAESGFDETHAFASGEGIPILLEIPFERRIAEAYSRGEPIVSAMPEWKERFRDLYKSIEEIVSRETGRSGR